MADMIECNSGNSRRTAFQLLKGFLPPGKKKQKEIYSYLSEPLFSFYLVSY
jgi:hypothetical protein